jgi:hypothetical protein
MRRTFVVGRVDRKTTEILLVQGRRPPIRGPFTVAAVVRPSSKPLHPGD